MTTEPHLTSMFAGHRLEAARGIEPLYAALQAATYTHETPGQRLYLTLETEGVTTT